MSTVGATTERLEARGLARSYHGKAAVRDVSLMLAQGEIVGLLGPNGAGKTTSFYMIAGLLPCDRGSIHIGAAAVTRLPIESRAALGLGYLPQHPSIFRGLSVRDNIAAVLETRRGLQAAERAHRLGELLATFKLEALAAQVGHTLSGGERRRVEIARAMAMEPRFLLLDEPFAGIDPITIQELQQVLTHLAHNARVGLLITDHHVREILRLCDRAYIVDEGQVIAHGDEASLLNDAKVCDVYLGDRFSM